MRWGLLLVTMTALALGACGGETCDAQALQAELDAAAPGAIVRANGCRYEGALWVPDGVTLRGRGPGVTIVAGAGEVAVELGEGAVLEALEVRVERGRAVSAEDAASLTLREVTLSGPVDEAGAALLPPLPSPTSTATHGLVIARSGTRDAPVRLQDVHVRGFARFGVLLLETHARWEGGSTSENLGTGLMVRGGSVSLGAIEICSTWRGVSPYGYGAVFRDGAEVTSDDLIVCDNEGAGALHDAVRVEHRALAASGNAGAALWVQRGDVFTLAGGVLSANTLAGVVLVETLDATLRDTRVEDTRATLTVLPDLGEVRAGDGVQAVLSSASGLRLERVTLRGNERVGLLLDVADGSVPAGALSEVVVESAGAALGAIAQSGSGVIDPASWAAGIDRRGSAVTNDAAAVDRLSVLGAVAPMFLPPPEP